ncbi:MAG: aminoacyl-tRNA hydrolase [Candidatus Omnitrophota bacterium]
MPQTRVIVGLGNPGKAYTRTRHNFGFLVLEQLVQENRCRFKKSLIFKSFVARTTVDDEKVYFLLPLTFMNLSGRAVKAFVQKKKIALENILVVCDDLDLDFGVLRLKAQGSSGGHKGLESLIEQLRTKEFARLRLGIGRCPPGQEASDYVLSEFGSQEKKKLEGIIEEALGCCRLWIQEGTTRSMSRFNRKNKHDQQI